MHAVVTKPLRGGTADKLRNSYRYPWLRSRLNQTSLERVDLAELDGGNVLTLEFDPRWQRVTANVRDAQDPQRFCRYLSFRVPADETAVRVRAVRIRDSYGFPVDDAVIEQMLKWSRAVGGPAGRSNSPLKRSTRVRAR